MEKSEEQIGTFINDGVNLKPNINDGIMLNQKSNVKYIFDDSVKVAKCKCQLCDREFETDIYNSQTICPSCKNFFKQLKKEHTHKVPSFESYKKFIEAKYNPQKSIVCHCPKCERGLIEKDFSESIMTNPPKYKHTCNKCGYEFYL